MLQLDMGDVITPRRSNKEGFQALAFDFLPFLCLYVCRYSPEALCVVSRVNSKVDTPERTWVFRTLDEVGFFDILKVPKSHLALCWHYAGEWGKGPKARAFSVTHAVDDIEKCLDSVRADCPTLVPGGLILFGGARSQAGDVTCVRGFRELGKHFGFSDSLFGGAAQLLNQQHLRSREQFAELFAIFSERFRQGELNSCVRVNHYPTLDEAFRRIGSDIRRDRLQAPLVETQAPATTSKAPPAKRDSKLDVGARSHASSGEASLANVKVTADSSPAATEDGLDGVNVSPSSKDTGDSHTSTDASKESNHSGPAEAKGSGPTEALPSASLVPPFGQWPPAGVYDQQGTPRLAEEHMEKQIEENLELDSNIQDRGRELYDKYLAHARINKGVSQSSPGHTYALTALGQRMAPSADAEPTSEAAPETDKTATPCTTPATVAEMTDGLLADDHDRRNTRRRLIMTPRATTPAPSEPPATPESWAQPAASPERCAARHTEITHAWHAGFQASSQWHTQEREAWERQQTAWQQAAWQLVAVHAVPWQQPQPQHAEQPQQQPQRQPQRQAQEPPRPQQPRAASSGGTESGGAQQSMIGKGAGKKDRWRQQAERRDAEGWESRRRPLGVSAKVGGGSDSQPNPKTQTKNSRRKKHRATEPNWLERQQRRQAAELERRAAVDRQQQDELDRQRQDDEPDWTAD